MNFEISGGNPQTRIELVNQREENGVFYCRCCDAASGKSRAAEV